MKNKIIKRAAVVAMCLISAPFSVVASEIKAEFIDREGFAAGTAVMQEMEHGVVMTLEISLPNGVHALHIHESGECDPPDFKNAGGHYNPAGKEHGYANPEGFHAGDLPNLHVQGDTVKQEIFLPEYKIRGVPGLLGRALIIHDKPDDYQSNPTGHAGKRIACAAISESESYRY